MFVVNMLVMHTPPYPSTSRFGEKASVNHWVHTNHTTSIRQVTRSDHRTKTWQAKTFFESPCPAIRRWRGVIRATAMRCPPIPSVELELK